jgi:hypothetical protein
MYCKECGTDIENDSKFCSYCGTKQSIPPIVEQMSKQLIESNAPAQTINVNLNLDRTKIENKKINSERIRIEKYDLTYKRDIEATVTGLVIIIVGIFLISTQAFKNVPDPETFKAIIGIINFLWRIIVTIWIIKIAKRQNRNTTGWGIFAFLIPNLALIIIGLLSKLNKPTYGSQKYNGNQVFDQERNLPEQESKEQIYKERIEYKDSDRIQSRSIKVGPFYLNRTDTQLIKIIFWVSIIIISLLLFYEIFR